MRLPKHEARRYVAGLALLAALSCGRLSAQDSPPAEPAAEQSLQTAMEIQADVLVDALLDELRSQLVEEGRMLQRMLDEPGRHRRRAESQAVLREWARGELETFYERKIREIHQRINREREVIRLDWLLGRAEIRRPGIKETAKTEALQKFEPAFARARETAVTRQWLDLEPWLKGFSPSAEEIERVADDGRRIDLAPLRQRLDSHLKTAKDMPWKDTRGEPVLLDENEVRLDQALGERIGRGLLELQTQRRILDRGQVRGALAQTLAKRLREKLSDHLRQAGDTGYGIFPSVEAAVPRRAEELAQAQLEEALSAGRVCLELSEDRLREWIAADLARHQEIQASRQLLLAEAPGKIGADLVTRLLEREEEAPEEAPRLVEQLAEERLAGILARGVEHCLGSNLGPARSALAGDQIRRYFPQLGAGQPLPEKAILAFRDSPDGKPEELVRETPVGEPLLAEARAEIARLLDQGRQALDQQMGLVDRTRSMIDGLRAEGRDRESIVQAARAEVLRQWRIWGRARSIYRELFKSTETRLDEIIDNAFARIPPPKETKPAEQVASMPRAPDPDESEEVQPHEEAADTVPRERPSTTQPTREAVREKPRRRGLIARLEDIRKALFEKEDSLSAEKRQQAEMLMDRLQKLLEGGSDPELLASLTALGELERFAGQKGSGDGDGHGARQGSEGSGNKSSRGDGRGGDGGGGDGRGGDGGGGDGGGGDGGGGDGGVGGASKSCRSQIKILERELRECRKSVAEPPGS